MKKPNNIENEINAVRIDFYEKTKGLSFSEMNAYIRTQTESVHKEFGIKAVSAEKS